VKGREEGSTKESSTTIVAVPATRGYRSNQYAGPYIKLAVASAQPPNLRVLVLGSGSGGTCTSFRPPNTMETVKRLIGAPQGLMRKNNNVDAAKTSASV
jgi:hypothetical protein